MATPFDYGVNYLSSALGLTPEQARGAVRWMDKIESGLNPSIVNPTSGAFGIAQHLGPRKQALFRAYGTAPSIEQQFSFIADELRGPEARALQSLRTAKTEDEAFRIWGRDFERPSPAEYAKATGGYSSGMRQRSSKPEGYYGGALNVTVRPPGVEFPIEAALDALLRGEPTEGDETGDPMLLLDGLLAAPTQEASPAIAPEGLAQPAQVAGPPAATSPTVEPASLYVEPPPEIRPLPGVEVPQTVFEPSRLLAQLLGETAPPAAQREVNVGTGIPLQTGPAQNPLPPETMLDQLLGAAKDIGVATAGVAEQAAAGALNTLRMPGQEPVRTQIPIAPGARAAEGALTFATGGLLSPLSTPLRGAVQAAQEAGRIAQGVSRETSAAMPALAADARGGVVLPFGPAHAARQAAAGEAKRTRVAQNLEEMRSGLLGSPSHPVPEAVKEALRRNGLLGFDTISEALAAIRSHPDWKLRWDMSDATPASLGMRDVERQRFLSDRAVIEKYVSRPQGSWTDKDFPAPIKSRRSLLDDEGGALNVQKMVDDIKETSAAAVRDLQMKVVPMAAGEDAGRAVAKDYAASERKARFWRSEFDTKLRKLSAADQKAMWEAMDNASVDAQMIGGRAGIEYGMRHIHALPDAQQKLLMDMERRGIELWEKARDVGMVAEGAERLPFYVMRGIVEIADDGVSRLASRAARGQGLTNIEQFGVNLTTRGPMSRGFLTAAQTEAAAKTFSENAEIVRNIRVLPMAYERFEKAIAGRRLINDLKSIGEATGKPTVVEGEALGDKWFTVPHPAFNAYRPRMSRNEAGEIGPVMDENGKVVIDKVPLYVSREFEGPMRSIMRGETGWWYNASMQLKGAAMATIMNSPVIHNAVEYGRALGAMPGKVGSFKIYFIGNQVRKNPRIMEKAIDDGLVPIGERGYMQDIEGIATGADLAPGRGLLAKGAGALTDVVSPQAGQAVRRGIDRAGDFWHQTLLWDRVADLQAGLYNEFTKDLIKKGVDRDTASKMAAHFANRFAGAVPNEAMSEGAKKLLNFVLFSRSFTTGNLGVMKDMVSGLPRDVQAQLGRNLTELERKAATSIARRKAIGTVMVDVGLMYLSNAILQSGIEALREDKGLDDVGRDYAERIGEMLSRARESPLDLLNPLHDVEMLRSISPLSTNEPGKDERVRLGYREDGTAVYIRSPVGKIGEEFEGWATRPLEMWRNKEGTIVRPLFNILENDRGFGGRVEQVYNRNPDGLGERAKVLGDILWEFMRSQTPELQLRAAGRMLSGKGDWVDTAQALAPFAGFTVSRGAPGGEAIGELYQASGEHEYKVRSALPEVRDLVRDGKYDEAQQKLEDLQVPPKLQRYYMKVYGTPEARLSPRAMRDFQRYSTPEQRRRMEMQMRRRDERDLRPPAAGP